MPAVTTYWRLPEEEQAFLDYVARTGGAVVYPFERVRNKGDLSPRPLGEYIQKHDPAELLMARPDHGSLVRIQEKQEGSETFYIPSHMRSPVIIYKRGALIGEAKLSSSNLAAYWSYSDGTRVVDQPAEFVTWAKKIFRWVRNETPVKVSKGWRVTSAVAEKMKEGLELVP